MLELVKNRGIKYGNEFIEVNRKELDNVFKKKLWKKLWEIIKDT